MRTQTVEQHRILSKVHTRWICSLECQYAVQQEDIEMIPLMMEQGCENTAASLYQYVHHGLVRRRDSHPGWTCRLQTNQMVGWD